MKNRYTPLIIIAVALSIFGMFLWIITRGGSLQDALDELQSKSNYEEIKTLWVSNSDINDDEDWKAEVEKKLSSLSLTNDQKADIGIWYPVRKYLNLVIVPDLSRRLTTIPQQRYYDEKIIIGIWDSFKKYCTGKQYTKDYLVVDATDDLAAGGQFKKIADELIIDLSDAGDKAGQVYLKEFENQFKSKITEMYDLGTKTPAGANYKSYIDRMFKSNEKASTLFDHYRNVAIILTDGYLETEDKDNFTRVDYPNSAIPVDPSVRLDNWEILILEVNERKNGDYPILKRFWFNWFNAMGVKINENIFFQLHNDAVTKTNHVVESFLQNNQSISISIKDQIDAPISKSSNSVPEYSKLLTEAELALKKENFEQAKLLLRKALQIKKQMGLEENTKANEMYISYKKFGDEALTAIQETGDGQLKDIPLRWYEIAQLIKDSSEIQAKINECKN